MATRERVNVVEMKVMEVVVMTVMMMPQQQGRRNPHEP